MNLQNVSLLLFRIGGFLLVIDCILLFAMVTGVRNREIPAIVPWAKGSKYLLKDLKDPKVKFGGLLGLFIWFLIISIACSLAGVIVLAVGWII